MSSSRFARSALLRLCSLEDRTVPASFGNPWPDARSLTISFAPDGTDVAGVASTMQADLAAQVGVDWQTEVLRAFQTWAAQTNVNLSVVADDGSALGTAAPPQGSPKFGDIRLASRPLEAGVLAAATPFDLLGGSWSGDVLLNSQTPWAKGDVAGRYDLATVLTHEAGHVFGLAGSDALADVMYEKYQGVRGLSANDIARARSLYDGARAADRFDAAPGANNVSGAAKEVAFVSTVAQYTTGDPTGVSKPFVALGDLASASDVDWFKVAVPAGSRFSVALRSGGVSLVAAQVTVYDSAFRVLGTATAASGGDLTLPVAASGTVYVKVEAAPGAGAFGAGSYRLAVGTLAADAAAKPAAAGFVNPDGRKNETFDKATDMNKLRGEGAPGWTYSVRGSVEAAGDKDVYKVKAVTQSFRTMLVTVFATTGTLDPALRILDEKGKPIAAQVISNDGQLMTLQLTGIDTKKDYFVEVSASNAGGTGNYVVGIDYRNQIDTPQTFGYGTLTAAAPEQASEVAFNQARLLHLVLSAASGSADAGVRLTVYDALHNPVATVAAGAGQTVTLDVLLQPGVYTFRVTGGMRTGAALGSVAFRVDALIRNDPLGPVAIDPGSEPSGTLTASPKPVQEMAPAAAGSTVVTVGPTTYYYVDPYAPIPLYSTRTVAPSLLWSDPFAVPFF